MRYLTIIVVCFLIASAIDLMGLFIFQRLGLIMTADTDMRNLPYALGVGFNLLLAVASFPVFLNLNCSIRSSVVLSAGSFFLLPIIMMIGLSFFLEEEALMGVILCLPYFIALLLAFVRFRKTLN